MSAEARSFLDLGFYLLQNLINYNYEGLFPMGALAVPESLSIREKGLGDSGTANAPIQTLFTSPEFSNTRWSFPTAHSNPVTCNNGRIMPSWFDVHKMPVTGEEWQTNRSARFTCFGKSSSNLKTPKDLFSGLSRAEGSPEIKTGLLDSVKRVHVLIDTEVASGTDPKNIFVCGLSQGGALTVASVLHDAALDHAIRI